MKSSVNSYLTAIDIIMCHLGKSFEEACEEVGVNPDELRHNSGNNTLLEENQQLDEH